MKTVKFILFGLVVIVLSAVPLYYLFFRLPLPAYSGILNIKGLSAPVKVHTDEYGIPHIYATNQSDLFFAQGYITARERMFQMDLVRLAGRGELSTVMGDRTLEKDRFFRTIGFYRRAKEVMASLPSPTARIIADYTRGVNAYMQSTAHLPREYFFLGTRPQPWEPEDSVVITLLMSYSLTRSKKADLVLHQIGQMAGQGVLNHIIPAYPDFAPTLTGKQPPNFAPGMQNAFLAQAKTGYSVVDDLFMDMEIPRQQLDDFFRQPDGIGQAVVCGKPGPGADPSGTVFHHASPWGGIITLLEGLCRDAQALAPWDITAALPGAR